MTTQHAAPEVRHGHAHHPAASRAKKAGQVIYVAPRGATGVNAGKRPARPLGNLTLALRRARAGATIILAPGIYTQNAGMTNKNNITIVGAADQSSILAPASGQALKVYTSSNITIQNVWFRSSYNGGIGLAVAGSSVNVVNVKTAGTNNDGVVVVGYAGQTGVLNATSSQFNASQVGNGVELRGGASATITNCTFNGNGTSPGATQFSNGMFLNGNATATITGSQFNGNTNAGLVVSGQAQVTVQQSTFSNNLKGDGAIFMDSPTVNLYGNTFASNGQVVGETTGLNGVEFLGGYSGNAVVSGNTFVNNTANGLFIGGAPNNILVSGNQFLDSIQGNVGGLAMDSSVTTIHATVVGNTFIGPANPANDQVGILALGNALTATVGGSGSDANVFQNYLNGNFINQDVGSGPNQGCPNLSFPGNSFSRNGNPVAPSDAIRNC